ncbi:hypothetical protein HDU97_005594 [Phlyctochytrium planicorne]|nr:hypothetical protein HDU97_005594 [Phlyctochytrium planicorne]
MTDSTMPDLESILQAILNLHPDQQPPNALAPPTSQTTSTPNGTISNLLTQSHVTQIQSIRSTRGHCTSCRVALPTGPSEAQRAKHLPGCKKGSLKVGKGALSDEEKCWMETMSGVHGRFENARWTGKML